MVRKGTTFATAAGFALVALVLASADMLAASIRKNSLESGRDDVAIVIRRGADSEFGSLLTEADAAILASQPGVARHEDRPLVSYELVVAVSMLKLDGSRGNLQLRGVPDHVMEVRGEPLVVAGRAPRFAAGEIMIGADIAERFRGLAIGQSLELRRGKPLKIVGVFRTGTGYDVEAWVDRETLRSIFGREGRASSVYARLADPAAFATFAEAIARDRRLGVEVFREREYFLKQTEGMGRFIGALGSFVAIFFGIAAMIGAMVTMNAAVANRQREIGTLRALGFSRTSILASFLLESLGIALLGGAVGALASIALASVDLSMASLSSRTETVLGFEPTAGGVVTALAISAAMGVAGGMLPAFRAARASVVAALRS